MWRAMEGHKHLLTVQSPFGREEQNVSAICHPLPSGNLSLGAGRDLLRAMKSHNFYRHCKCAGEERGTERGTGGSQRATQERAKKRWMVKGGSEHPALFWACWGSAVFTPNPAPATAG